MLNRSMDIENGESESDFFPSVSEFSSIGRLNHLQMSLFSNCQYQFLCFIDKLTSYIGKITVFSNHYRCQDKPLRSSHQQSHYLMNCHGQRPLPYNFMHCTFCALYFNGYVELQEYAKQQEIKHRRKIILPCVIPWEYGSNKFASQKGTSGFGSIRNATTTIKCGKQLSESNDGVVPWMNCPQLRDKELASQAGLTPFGGIREHVIKVHDKEGDKKKQINKIVGDQISESILKIWSQANPDAKNDQLFGKHRDAVTEVKGGRQFSQEELNASRAAIPKFQDPRETIAAKAQKTGDTRFNRLLNSRQTPMQNDDMEKSKVDISDSHYLAWIGGQLTLQSQSHPSGLQNSQEVVSTSYFDRIMSERERMVGKGKAEKVQHEGRKQKKVNDVLPIPIQPGAYQSKGSQTWSTHKKNITDSETMNNAAHIFFVYLVISLCNILSAEEIIPLSDKEILNLVDKFREKDSNRAEDWQITLDYSHYWKSNPSSGCSERLFQWVDPNLLEKETYKQWIKLSKLYDSELGIEKNRNENGNGKKRAVNEFLDAIMNTEVWKSFYQYLSQKGYQHATSSKVFRALIKQLWFGRSSEKFRNSDSTGFEHVFLGQKLMALLKFNWENQIKKTTFFIGTSPEFDMALNTLCFLTRPSKQCTIILENCPFAIITQPVVHQGTIFLKTAYPTVGNVSDGCLQYHHH
uniref:Endoribonuclease n=1 Tax=Setaria digitata TaxID=48799 RepID=A0A915PWV8_9BILA